MYTYRFSDIINFHFQKMFVHFKQKSYVILNGEQLRKIVHQIPYKYNDNNTSYIVETTPSQASNNNHNNNNINGKDNRRKRERTRKKNYARSF